MGGDLHPAHGADWRREREKEATMRFRLGVITGFGAGYVLGSRAGRERYEQIRRWWGHFTGSPTVHRATERARGLAGEQSKRALYAVQSGMGKAGSAVKERLGDHGDPAAEMEDLVSGPQASGTASEVAETTIEGASQP